MISVDEAKARILETVSIRPSQRVPLEKTLGKVISENIVSPIDLPSFHNSAMDGYAVCLDDDTWQFSVVGTVQAGDHPQRRLQKGEAVRIFTGAMIPPGADCVVKQEDVIQKEKNVINVARSLKRGENIRYQGEEIKKGNLLLQAGERLTSAAIGLLANGGLREIPIVSPPRIGILITGSEIVMDIDDLSPGKIFDSNSFALTAALEELHLIPSFVQRVSDDPVSLRRAVSLGLSQSDFLIVTGGVSVGDFDFVKDVSKQVGIEEVFWKVKQKPGKPIFFGKGRDTALPPNPPSVGSGDHRSLRLAGRSESDPANTRSLSYLFGLPGNPVSALVCFYEYVRPALLRSMGAKDLFLMPLRVPLKGSFQKKSGLTHFLRSILSSSQEGNSVEILENQGSHRMTSFAEANCLVILPEEQEEFQKGGEVEIHLLPS